MSRFDSLKFRDNAIHSLAEKLSNGSLVLFLGAGTSRGFGLPGWLDFVNSLRKEVKLSDLPKTSTSEELQAGSSEVRRALKSDDELFDLIEKCLYEKLDDLSSVDIFENHLLIAVSALLMGSKRGHVTRVVTLNYDSMLEWFLSLFGFVVKTIYDLPELEGSEDVRIYHPHGFMPHLLLKKQRSNFVILDRHSINKRLGTPGDPWFELTRHILQSGFCLFIGMSFSSLTDYALSPLFATVGEKLALKRPIGIWIIKEVLTQRIEDEFDTNNIIPFSIQDPKEISKFLIQICEKAAVL